MDKIMKVKKFLDTAKAIASDNTVYALGCYGQTVTKSILDSKRNQSSRLKEWYDSDCPHAKGLSWYEYLLTFVDKGYQAYDCVCYIKGILWGSSATKCGTYKANDVPDLGANEFFKVCTDKTSNLSNLKPGMCVWFSGHVGIVLDSKHVLEAAPSLGKVAVTSITYQKWKQAGYIPWVDYTEETVVAPSTNTTTTLKFKAGDIVSFKGGKHYSSSNATNGISVKASRARITSVNLKGKHPYHCRAVNTSGSCISGVYGWVDADSVQSVTGMVSSTSSSKWTPKVGDVVSYNGKVHYLSANSSIKFPCKGGKAKISRIYKLGKSKHPYHLTRVSGKGATVYGWVDEGTFTKG